MGTIDWSSEEADVWMRSVRAADKAGQYHGVRFRAPLSPTEALLAADVARRRFRSSFGGAGSRTVASGGKAGKPRVVRRAVVCAKCGARRTPSDLRLWRTIWTDPRVDLYRCAGGCQKGKGA